MTIFFSADHHFGHKNIIKYTNRPFDNVKEMNEALIKNHNSLVKPNDTVYFLGDFGLAPKDVLKEILSRMNGKKKILIRGNHDKAVSSMLEIGFDEVHRYMDLNINKIKILLCHVPIFSAYHDIVVSGHVHDLFFINGNILNVGVDVNFFRPISLRAIEELFAEGFFDKKNFKSIYDLEHND